MQDPERGNQPDHVRLRCEQAVSGRTPDLFGGGHLVDALHGATVAVHLPSFLDEVTNVSELAEVYQGIPHEQARSSLRVFVRERPKSMIVGLMFDSPAVVRSVSASRSLRAYSR